MNNMLVVLYKTKLSDSLTITSILEYLETLEIRSNSEHTLTIWDNSHGNTDIEVEELNNKIPYLQISYTRTPKNISLSKIYNNISSGISVNDYLTIFDQDTALPMEYFRKLLSAQRDRHPLILPIVKCNNVIVSPGKRFISKGYLLSNINSGLINSKNILAINSGMSIAAKVFDKISYDERLRFYGTDTFFMYQYEIYYKTLFVLDCVVEHSLAEMEVNSCVWREQHMREKLRTFKIIFSNNLFEKVYVKFYSIFIKIRFKMLEEK